jgi:hypothetical protein
MDIDLYVAEMRLAELRELATRHRLARAARSLGPGIRAGLRQALTRLNDRVLAAFAPAQTQRRTLGTQKEPF